MDAFIFLVQGGFLLSDFELGPAILEDVTRSCKSVTYVVEVSGLGRPGISVPLSDIAGFGRPFFTRNEKAHL